MKKDQNDLLAEGKFPNDIADDSAPFAAEPEARRMAESLAGEAHRREPCDLNAEVQLLAALFWCGAYAPGTVTVATVQDVLDDPSMMFSPAHKVIFRAMWNQHRAGKPVDVSTVNSELIGKNEIRAAGGIEYLEKLVASAAPTSESKARAYAQAIRDCAVRRALIVTTKLIESLARGASGTAQQAVESAYTLVSELAQASATSADFIRLSTCLADIVRNMQSGTSNGLYTGFRDLDDRTAGLFPKEVTILAARTSVGKSTLAAQVSMNVVTAYKDQAVLYVSLEMPARSFTMRLLSSESHVHAGKFRRQVVTDSDSPKVMAAASKIGQANVYFAESQQQTLMSISSIAAKLAAKLARDNIRLAMIVVDHIGLVKPSGEAAKRSKENQVSETSRALRYLASEYSCHVIGICQIGREAEKTKGDGKIPQLHHLRDSGTIENDADSVWILHRDFDGQGMPVPKVPAILAIAKSRNDAKGIVKLQVEPEFCRFNNYTE